MTSEPRSQILYITADSYHALSIVFEAKMLYFIGLGLADETDITVKGLEVVKKAARVYLEAYTSILLVDKSKLVRPFMRPFSSFH